MAIAVILLGIAALALAGLLLRGRLARRARGRKGSRYFSVSLIAPGTTAPKPEPRPARDLL